VADDRDPHGPLVQPTSIGPFSFGTSTYVSKAATEPGAVSLTVLEVRSAEEGEEIRRRSRDVATEMLAMPGFIGPDFARGGQTGVWSPHRLNGMWVRCEACGEMVLSGAGPDCRCGAALPAAPRYW